MAGQQRDFFRLIYPPSDRPTIQIEESNFLVGDLSEQGVKFYHAETVNFPVGVRLKARIVFKDGSHCDVIGDILRVIHDPKPSHTVVEFHEGVPMGKMLEEQRLLIKKYKKEDLEP